MGILEWESSERVHVRMWQFSLGCFERLDTKFSETFKEQLAQWLHISIHVLHVPDDFHDILYTAIIIVWSSV
jgi:hypothetical protein